jgi:hypothetical protein
MELRLPVTRFLFFPDLIQVLRDLKVTHPSLARLESDSSKSLETWKWLIQKWLIQILRDLKVTHQKNQPTMECPANSPSCTPWTRDSSGTWQSFESQVTSPSTICRGDIYPNFADLQTGSGRSHSAAYPSTPWTCRCTAEVGHHIVLHSWASTGSTTLNGSGLFSRYYGKI